MGAPGAASGAASDAAKNMENLQQPRIVDVKARDIEVRLAESEAEIDAALALRYRVFYDEMAARPTPEMVARKRDFDDFDSVCDHLLVFDRALGSGPEAVVGTYRLIRRSVAESHGGFYSADEYDVSMLVDFPGEVLELGRSCIDLGHRDRMTMKLMWRGLATYVLHYNIEIMFGCASLHGTDVDALALPLSYLHHNSLAPQEIRPKALPDRYSDMNLMPADEIDEPAALAALPPLIKGYLRLGGFVGEGAVIDHQFNTVDVCIVVKTDRMTGKYYRHYTRGESAPGGADAARAR